MFLVRLLVAASLGGCAWVTPEDIARRAPELDDDADGVPKSRDCNDDDPTVAPTFPEIWYNGVDNDCRGDDDYDQDLDGFVADAHVGLATAGAEGTGALPGGDCDDSPVRPETDESDSTLPFGPRVSPRQPDTWYDGVDQDCSGNDDYDMDGDGYVPDAYATFATRYVEGSGALPGGDCDDEEPDVHADQDEQWYDGLDRDCDGADDYDRDGDGWVPADVTYRPTAGVPGTGQLDVGDCDDDDASIHDGAPDAWYDGVDSNCRGDDDYDRDLDGFRTPAGGGMDCDDTVNGATVYPGALERLGDALDGDCDGGNDDITVRSLEGYTLDDIHRMEFLATSRRVYLSVAAGVVETSNAVLYDSAVAWTWYPTNLLGPAVAFVPWYAAASVDDPAHALSNAAMAAVSVASGTGYADMLYGAFGIADLEGGASQVRLHRYDIERSISRGGPVSTVAFDDLALAVEPTGRMHVLACDREGVGADAVGTLRWLRWTPNDELVPTIRSLAAGTGDAAVASCAMRVDADDTAHAVTSGGDGTVTSNFDTDAASWTLGPPSRVAGRQLLAPKFPEGFLAGTVVGIDADRGTVVIADPFTQDDGLVEVGEDVVHADAWQEGITDFTIYVAWVNGSGEAWLARRAPGATAFVRSRVGAPFTPSWIALHGNADDLLLAVAGDGRLAVEAVAR